MARDKFGFAISQEGENVLTCEDEEMAIASWLNLLKNAIIGLSVGAGSVAHGLSYIPVFMTSKQSSGKGSILGDDGTSTCDATNINVGATTKYYVFYQQGI